MKRIRPAAKAVIEKDGKILVLKTEASGETYYVLPGGKIEYGETAEDALLRELEEELNCKASIQSIVGTYNFFTGPEDDGDEIIAITFRADISGQEIDIESNPAEDENILEACWMTPKELIDKSNNNPLRELIKAHRDSIKSL